MGGHDTGNTCFARKILRVYKFQSETDKHRLQEKSIFNLKQENYEEPE